MRIAFFGDVVGMPGIRLLQQELGAAVRKHRVDFVVANGENLAQGAGITRGTAEAVFGAGVDVLTNGDHVFRRRQEFRKLQSDPRIVRPANLPPRAAGRGHTVVNTRSGLRVAVVNLIGRVFMDPADCPFRGADAALEALAGQADVVLVDFHAEATSEKMAMGWHLDGRVSAVVGTHTHTPTADHQILTRGTAYISDLGMVGAYDSVIGRVKDRVLYRFVTGMPTTFHLAERGVRGPGLLVTVDGETGRAEEVCPLLLGEPLRRRGAPC
ncbi:MAG: YmdB family metallophosphoesterase [Planctomycetes bacterium]|nr:YmdB family metallophosphoesterase [Planctomycetota bacterium]